MCVGEEEFVDCLKQGSHYKFLGIMENIKQDDTLVLEIASKAYIKDGCNEPVCNACAHLFNDNPVLADYGITKARQRTKKGDFGEWGYAPARINSCDVPTKEARRTETQEYRARVQAGED